MKSFNSTQSFLSALAFGIGLSQAAPIYTVGIDPFLSGTYTEADKLINVEARNLSSDGDWELGLGQTNTGGLTTAHLTWVKNASYAFTISQSAGTTTFSLGGKNLVRNDLAAANDLFLEAKTSAAGGNATITGIAVDGIAFGGSLVAEKNGTHLDILRIQGITAGDWTLTGNLAFTWDGATGPRGSRTELILKGFYEEEPSTVVPEPSTAILALIGLGILAYSRRRKV